MKIAIVGAGFFGTTSAIILAKKHKVHLYEKENDILLGASKKNQLRFHLGYHYPRSIKTVDEIKKTIINLPIFLGKKFLVIQKIYMVWQPIIVKQLMMIILNF